MHRSGTSAVTGLLRDIGIATPRHPLAADEHNPTGYWEPAPLVALNDSLLADAGSRAMDWRAFNDCALGSERRCHYQSEIRRVLLDEYRDAGIFVVKDPRICRLIPLYEAALGGEALDRRYLLVLRDPAAVAASLAARDGTALSFGLLLWLRHVLDAERFTRNARRVLVVYEDVLADPYGAMSRINEALRLNLGMNGGWTSDTASLALRHHVRSIDEMPHSPLTRFTAQTYAALLSIAANGPNRAAEEALEMALRCLNADADLVGEALFAEIAGADNRIRASRDYFQDLAERRQAEIERLGRVLAGLEAGRLQGALDEARAGRLAAEQALRQLRNRIEEVQLERDVTSAELRRVVGGRAYRAAQILSAAHRRSRVLQYLFRRFPSTPAAAASLRPRIDPAVHEAVAASPLFDAGYYLERYAETIGDPGDPVSDFLAAAPGTRDPGPLFSSQFYYSANSDVAANGMNPLVHYLRYGSKEEGRVAFSPIRVKDFLGTAPDSALVGLADILEPGTAVTVLYTEGGNFFFRDIAFYLGHLLAERGYDVAVDTAVPAARGGSVPVVVAPHEYFLTEAGKKWSPAQVAAAAYVNTEQWQTSWFALALRQLLASRVGVLDINPTSAAGLARLGQRAAFLPILPLPGSVFEMKRAPLSPEVVRHKFVPPLTHPAQFAERPVEVAFVGVRNERRSRALGLLAPVLARHACFLHCPRFDRPIVDGDPDRLGGSDLAQIAANTRILINIHRDDVGYLEWHRVFLYGIMAGSVVVTEPCFETRFVAAGTHYLEAPLPEMADLLARLLETEAGRAQLADVHRNNLALAQRIAAGERLMP